MKKTSRNELCWCGSGLKYKKCHMEFDEKIDRFKAQGYLIPHRSLIKTQAQIEGIRKSGRLTKRILDMVGERIEAGITTEEINGWVHEYTIENGAKPAPLNYRGYPKSTCTSINNVICHGIPGETVLKTGDIINVDVTTILGGYYADASRMYLIGDVSEKAAKLVRVAKECMDIGIKQVKAFNTFNAIGAAIDAYAGLKGYSIVRDLGGHGIGLQFHEEPHIHHYKRNDKEMLMLPGMVFTIEPMVNEGTYECEFMADCWTVLTKDGLLSAQWEHTVLVTNDGFEILTG